LAQEIAEAADFEEEVLRIAQLRRGAAEHRARFLQIGRRVGGAAVFAVVAVLVGRAAIRADALDVAVGQEHALRRIVELRDAAPRDVAARIERGVDRFGQLAIGRRVGRVVVIEGDVEIGEVAFVLRLDRGDELLGRRCRLSRRPA
jgi:hypothetical protein